MYKPFFYPCVFLLSFSLNVNRYLGSAIMGHVSFFILLWMENYFLNKPPFAWARLSNSLPENRAGKGKDRNQVRGHPADPVSVKVKVNLGVMLCACVGPQMGGNKTGTSPWSGLPQNPRPQSIPEKKGQVSGQVTQRPPNKVTKNKTRLRK